MKGTLLALLLTASSARAGDFAGLTPGKSTMADAREKLGAPLSEGAATVFSGEPFKVKNLRVTADDATGVISMMRMTLVDPPPVDDLRGWLGLGASVVSGGGEYYPTQGVVLWAKEGRVVDLAHVAPEAMSKRFGEMVAEKLMTGDRTGAEALAKAWSEGGDAAVLFSLASIHHEAGDQAGAAAWVREGRARAPENESGELLEAFIAAAADEAAPGWLGIHWTGTVVARVFPDTPAAQAGIKAGDEVSVIEGKLVKREELASCLGRLKTGKPGTVRFFHAGALMPALTLTPIDRESYFGKRARPADPLELVHSLMAQGHLGDARAVLEGLPPESVTPELLFEWALALEAGDYEKGLAQWNKFAAGRTDRTSIDLIGYGAQETLLLEKGADAYRKAVKADEAGDFKRAAALYPDLPVACSSLRFRRGYMLKSMGRLGAAAAEFRASRELWPGETMSIHHRAECLEAFDLAGSRAASLEYLRWGSDQKSAAKRREAAQARMDRTGAALARLKLGDRAAALGLWAQALADYEAAQSLSPASVQIVAARVRALQGLGRGQEAETLRAETLKSGDTPAHEELRARRPR